MKSNPSIWHINSCRPWTIITSENHCFTLNLMILQYSNMSPDPHHEVDSFQTGHPDHLRYPLSGSFESWWHPRADCVNSVDSDDWPMVSNERFWLLAFCCIDSLPKWFSEQDWVSRINNDVHGRKFVSHNHIKACGSRVCFVHISRHSFFIVKNIVVNWDTWIESRLFPSSFLLASPRQWRGFLSWLGALCWQGPSHCHPRKYREPSCSQVKIKYFDQFWPNFGSFTWLQLGYQ